MIVINPGNDCYQLFPGRSIMGHQYGKKLANHYHSARYLHKKTQQLELLGNLRKAWKKGFIKAEKSLGATLLVKRRKLRKLLQIQNRNATAISRYQALFPKF